MRLKTFCGLLVAWTVTEAPPNGSVHAAGTRASPAGGTLSNALTLETAVALALEHNPALRAARARV